MLAVRLLSVRYNDLSCIMVCNYALFPVVHGDVKGNEMKKLKKEFTRLRILAEEKIRLKDPSFDEDSGADVQKIIHELRVHQEELEIQNEELRQTQLLLEASHCKYTNLYDFAPVGYLTLDKDGIILEVNLTASRMLDIERHTLFKSRFGNYVANEDKDSFHLYLRKVFKTKSAQSCELRCIKKHGGKFHANFESIYVEGSDNTGLCRTSLTDITEKRKANAELSVLSEVVEQSPVSVMITDPQGNLEYVNPQFTVTTGYEPEEVIGKNPRILKSGAQLFKVYKRLWDTIIAGYQWKGELQNKKKNGELCWNLVSISPLRGQDGTIKHFIGINEDITARKLIEDELAMERNNLEKTVDVRTNELKKSLKRLKDNYAALQKAELARDTMAHMLVHDMRNSLGVIKGSVQIMQAGDDNNESTTKNTQRIVRAVDDIAVLLKSVLDVSRFESGKMPITLEPLNVSQIVKEIYNQFIPQAEEKGIHLSVKTELNEIIALADSKLLVRILQNLVNNGLKHTRDSLIISTSINDKWATISVSDNGQGIPEEYKEKIFDKYFQIESGKNRKKSGVGLGLAFCKMAVEAQNGTILVEGEENKGVTFKVKFNALG